VRETEKARLSDCAGGGDSNPQFLKTTAKGEKEIAAGEGWRVLWKRKTTERIITHPNTGRQKKATVGYCKKARYLPGGMIGVVFCSGKREDDQSAKSKRLLRRAQKEGLRIRNTPSFSLSGRETELVAS